MSTTVKVLLADDIQVHRDLLVNKLEQISTSGLIQFDVLKLCDDGQELLDALSGVAADIVFTDIRMPNMDGLTALFMIRQKLKLNLPVVMISSEQEENINRMDGVAVNPSVNEMTWTDKMALMKKVESRVLSGIEEEGKMNNLLDGCSRLLVDPIQYAKELGANGYVVKPYSRDKLEEIITAVLNRSGFLCT